MSASELAANIKRRGLAANVKRLGRSLLFALLALAVLGALLWYGDAKKVFAVIDRFQRIYIVWFVLLMLLHEVVRGLLWKYLLQALAVRVPLRSQIFAFAAGEAAKFLPTGAYVQNYLLQRSTRTDFGRSSAATTVIIVAEIAVALAGVALLGVGTWSLGLRIAIVVVALAIAALVWAYRTVPHVRRTHRWATRRKILNLALEEFGRFRAGTAALAHPRIMGITLLLTAIYVLLAGAGLYLVVRGLGIGGISFWQAVAVNCFGLAFYVVLGSLEAADVGVLLGLGVSKSAAVSAILVNRGLNIGTTLAFAVITMAYLRDEWPKVLWRRKR